jgi:predicted transcriptional regulator YdeE
METETRTLGTITVMGIARRLSNEKPEEIGKMWQEFLARGGAARIPGRKSDELYAVYTDYEGDHTKPFTLIIGCEVDATVTTPEGLRVKTIPAGKFEVFEAKGPQPAALVAAWKRVWDSPIRRAYEADVEHYRGPEDVEIFVGVK